MKKQEVFERTVDVLVKAYHNGTLEHGHCKSCAVGNLIRATMYDNNPQAYNESWFHSVGCSNMSMEDLRLRKVREGTQSSRDYYSLVIKEIESTGYTIEELRMIERVFEDNCTTPEGAKDKSGLYGLRAVYEELLNIHEVDVQRVATAEEVFA